MNRQSNNTINNYTYLNLKNIKCPVSILKLKLAIKNLHHGQYLKVAINTIGQVNEIKSFCSLSDVRVLMEENKGNCYYLLLSLD